jgi:hypothetical protein
MGIKRYEDGHCRFHLTPRVSELEANPGLKAAWHQYLLLRKLMLGHTGIRPDPEEQARDIREFQAERKVRAASDKNAKKS